jgi:hypothetical protein
MLAGGLLGAGLYFYQVAVVPGQKSFLSKKTPLRKSDPLYHQKLWYENANKQRWTIKSAGGSYRLVANYIPATHKSAKTVLIAHGFNGSKDDMGAYAYLFHQLGYNVLLRDARGHGQSQGNYIGYGWPDRLDDKKWIQQIIRKNGDQSKIVMFGVSMGGRHDDDGQRPAPTESGEGVRGRLWVHKRENGDQLSGATTLSFTHDREMAVD